MRRQRLEPVRSGPIRCCSPACSLFLCVTSCQWESKQMEAWRSVPSLSLWFCSPPLCGSVGSVLVQNKTRSWHFRRRQQPWHFDRGGASVGFVSIGGGGLLNAQSPLPWKRQEATQAGRLWAEGNLKRQPAEENRGVCSILCKAGWEQPEGKIQSDLFHIKLDHFSFLQNKWQKIFSKLF